MKRRDYYVKPKKEESTCNELVVVLTTNAMRFPEVQAFWKPCRKLKNYSMLFCMNEEDLIASCLKANHRGSVCIFNLETRHVLLLKGIFTQVKVTKLQSEDYYIQYKEISQRTTPILFEFQTLTKEELTIY